MRYASRVEFTLVRPSRFGYHTALIPWFKVPLSPCSYANTQEVKYTSKLRCNMPPGEKRERCVKLRGKDCVTTKQSLLQTLTTSWQSNHFFIHRLRYDKAITSSNMN